MASQLTPQQSPQAPSSSFWQLISGVAHDLDLMLQDLFPDAIPSPLREEYGLTDDIALDHESFANHASLLEQFMRGAGPDSAFLGPSDPGSEYRSSKSLFAETPTSDSCDGRTTPTSTSSPSPPPPAPPPRSVPSTSLLHYPADYSANVQDGPAPSVGAQSAMVSSSSISSVQETSDGDSSHTSSSFAPCDIGLLERLIRTHPIWFLPGIGRAGAVHLLQGKDVGNFIVRQSSKPNTMALSVRLPEDKGPYVEHYLIETVGDAQLRLEGSDNNFHAIPMLVAHYCQCCDELPVQLALPCPLAQAGSRQELSSLALLGQDFWLSSLVQSPAHAPPSGPFHTSGPGNNLPLHSTFKPAPSLSNLPNGSSQSPALAMNNSEHVPDSSPSSGSPPPPVAPKHQAHNAPPPPPPRSFLTSRTSSVSNLPATQNAGTSETSDLSSPSTNNDSKSQPTVINGEKSEITLSKSEELENKKSEKKIARVAHYKQSNIVDLTPAYYKSSLADKISDYEDIWGNTISKESGQKTKLKTFQSSSKNEDSYVESLKRRNHEFLKKQQSDNILAANFCFNQGTQTEAALAAAAMLDASLSDMQNHTENKFDVKDDSSPEDRENFSSPFYSEPVDSLPVNSVNSKKPALSDLDLLPQRLFNHRFSDPNLHWPQNSSCRKVESTLDEERLASLSSSVDNIKGLGPSPQHRKPMSTQWVQELNQRISSHSTKKDCQTQVSINDLISQRLDCKKSSSPKKGKGHHSNSAWPLDSSWEWMAHDDSSSDENDMPLSGTLDLKFPLHLSYRDVDSQLGDTTTVEDIIALRSPELALPDIRPLTQSNVMRVSEYDNLDRPPDLTNNVVERQRVSDVVDDAATEFCEPWDSLRWERLFGLMIPETDILGDDDTVQREKMENHRNMILENNKKNETVKPDISSTAGFEDNESNSTVSAYSDITSEGNDDTSASDYPTIGSDRYRNKSFEERLEPLLAAQRVVALRNRSMSRIGENIRHYIFRLADERDNTFAKSIEHFIQCTKESTETKPAIVMRNIRQFMSGIKNYLLKHGEGRFENLVQEERSKLRSDEFLDIDAVIEDSLHKLVIKPLKGYIYQLFVNEYTRNGSLKLLSDNIKFARTKTPEELGVRPEFKLPEGTSLEVVKHFFNRLQQAYSPLKKLENLLAAISTIYNSVQQDKIAQGKEHVSLGAGDFLPIFICVLVQCGVIAAEIEAEYMWGLLHPSLMAREGGYYLTTLSSAVHVLKSLQACSPESPLTSETSFDNLGGASSSGRPYGVDIGSPRSQLGCKTPSPEPRLACIADLQGFLKIMIPDELTGSIISKTLPIKPNMTTKEVAKLIAHKFNVTNPQDYNLFKLVDGEETMLGDSECPQVIKADLMATGSNCLFTYKRCDAKFIWPIMEKSS